jgi:hypothetical protein
MGMGSDLQLFRRRDPKKPDLYYSRRTELNTASHHVHALVLQATPWARVFKLGCSI